jgi:hypothetical protein
MLVGMQKIIMAVSFACKGQLISNGVLCIEVLRKF